MAGEEKKRERNPISAIARVLSVLAESDAEDIGVREIARLLDLSPSTIQRTLDAAKESGLVTQSLTGGWGIGWEFHRIASLGMRHRAFAAADPVLDRLKYVTDETVVLTVYEPVRAERMFVEAKLSSHPVRFVPRTYEWLPMYAGATAHAILAFRPAAEVERILDAGIDVLTERTVASRNDLIRVLDSVRESGVSVSDDEVNLGATAIAVPVHTKLGVVSSVGVITPRQRYDPARNAEITQYLVHAADQLGEILGDPARALEFLMRDNAPRPSTGVSS